MDGGLYSSLVNERKNFEGHSLGLQLLAVLILAIFQTKKDISTDCIQAVILQGNNLRTFCILCISLFCAWMCVPLP